MLYPVELRALSLIQVAQLRIERRSEHSECPILSIELPGNIYSVIPQGVEPMNLPIRSRLLYPVELRDQITLFLYRRLGSNQ